MSIFSQDTTTPTPVSEVYLGSRDPASSVPSSSFSLVPSSRPTTSLEIINIDRKPFDSPHKIPTNLWSAFERNRGNSAAAVETSAASRPRQPESADINDEGLSIASIMSYTMPKDNNKTAAAAAAGGKVEIVEIDELPKPSEHESEVLVVERVSLDNADNAAAVETETDAPVRWG